MIYSPLMVLVKSIKLHGAGLKNDSITPLKERDDDFRYDSETKR
jgi:hypothetical protein